MRKSTSEDAEPADADSARLAQALESLGLVNSELGGNQWTRRVTEELGADIVRKWKRNARKTTDVRREYDLTYGSFENAKHLSASFRSAPLAAECAWMLPRLRDAITRSGHPDPFLVEIGAGPGAAAAVLSAALQVPVIAVDAHPLTAGLPEQFAQCTGGKVTSHVADIADLADILDGRIPAAVFGMGIYRYLQLHQHGGDSFSYWFEMERILATHTVDSHVTSFIAALGDADLVLSETTCMDYLAEMAAGLFAHSYQIPQGGITRITSAMPYGPATVVAIHFSKADLPARNPNLLMEMCSPLPRPHADFASDPNNDPAAEALRLSLGPTEFIEANEIVYIEEAVRHRREVFGFGKHLIGRYEATTQGYRNLKFFPRKDLEVELAAIRENEAELEEAGAATIQPCTLPAPQWDGPLDN
jgi:hypothetical protein